MSIPVRSIIDRGGKRVRGLHYIMPRRTDELSDEQLMDHLARREEVGAALSALYDRYSRTVFGVGVKLLGDRSSAEELVRCPTKTRLCRVPGIHLPVLRRSWTTPGCPGEYRELWKNSMPHTER